MSLCISGGDKLINSTRCCSGLLGNLGYCLPKGAVGGKLDSFDADWIIFGCCYVGK